MLRSEKLYDIGEWVATEDGYGQLIYNRSIYYEEFDLALGKHKKGDFNRSMYICKILCDFDGKVKSRFKIGIYTSINKVTLKERKYITDIKTKYNELYNKYLKYESKDNLTRQVFLEYNIENDQVSNAIEEIRGLHNRLPRTFTFKEFKKEANNSLLPFKISNFIRYNEIKDRAKCITIRLDSELYKTKAKEALFRDLVVIKY